MPFYDAYTEFIFVEDKPLPSDIIFVPGGAYGEIAEHAAALYHQNLAPYLLVSGKYSILTGEFSGALSPASYTQNTYTYECDFLADVLLQNGVPKSAVLLDNKAAYTYENAIYSKKLTSRLGITVHSAILSCQAYHARRCLLYYQEQFPNTTFYVSPAVTQDITRSNWHQSSDKIDIVLGEVTRCGSQFHDILKRSKSN